MVLAATVELAGEGVIERDEIVRPLDHGDDDGDEPPGGGPAQSAGATVGSMRVPSADMINEPPRRSGSRARSRARC